MELVALHQFLRALVWGVAFADTPVYVSRLSSSKNFLVVPVFVLVYALGAFWERRVTPIVPEPYLDEVFHIPQAQAYCERKFDVWDPKLTTPAGLYVFSSIFGTNYTPSICNPATLRTFNLVALLFSLCYAIDCRALITKTWKRDQSTAVLEWLRGGKPLSSDTLHTGLNVVLFPLIFFFSGLFYTDVLSTCIVLRVYRLYLERKGAYGDSAQGLVWLLPTGLVALTMRQTNIFWIAVFLGAMEVVRTLKANKTNAVGKQSNSRTWKSIVDAKLREYIHAQIHDVSLKDAGVHDFILCAISIAVAIVSHPLLILVRLWPYICLLGSFGAFVVWNGGVVLGDKSNHVATIHLPQMLYIWPLMAFFSAPLIVPIGISWLQNLAALISLPLFPRLVWQYALVSAYTGAALAVTLLIIKFNTIIHPFTLADNRHYMFYIFRYTILRHPLIRYALAPIYLICAYLVYLTLSGPSKPHCSSALLQKNSAMAVEKKLQPTEDSDYEGPTTSFVLIFVATTALSLVTAPLVEPRYFIIPWVIWRLNVPPLQPSSSPTQKPRTNAGQGIKEPRGFLQTHDYRLWLETAWFLLINVVTGYTFLYRGFEWPQEPGKVQRFMW